MASFYLLLLFCDAVLWSVHMEHVVCCLHNSLISQYMWKIHETPFKYLDICDFLTRIEFYLIYVFIYLLLLTLKYLCCFCGSVTGELINSLIVYIIVIYGRLQHCVAPLSNYFHSGSYRKMWKNLEKGKCTFFTSMPNFHSE